MDDIKAQFQGYLVGQLILSFLGALMLLLGDFGGFYYRNYSGATDVYGYIYLGSGVLSTALILLGISGLLVSFLAALKSLQSEDVSMDLIKKNAHRSIQGATFTASLAFVGAIILFLNNYDNEWWLDTGFYGAFFGGVLVAFPGRLILVNIKEQGDN